MLLDEAKKELLKDPGYRAVFIAAREDANDRVAQMVCVARVRQGLTQEELAKKVGTKQSAIARLESGNSNVSLGFLQRIASALGTKLLSPRFEFLKKDEDARDREVERIKNYEKQEDDDLISADELLMQDKIAQREYNARKVAKEKSLV